MDSADELKRHSKEALSKDQEVKPVSIMPKDLVNPQAEDKFKVGDVVRVKHAFAYDENAGLPGVVCSVLAWNSSSNKYHVRFESGQTGAYGSDRLVHITDVEYNNL